jgi:hypothetical protein
MTGGVLAIVSILSTVASRMFLGIANRINRLWLPCASG